MLGFRKTISEQRRFDAIQQRGCVPCWLEAKLQGRKWVVEPCDIHHVDQSDEFKTYGNCPWHHRGVCKMGFNQQQMVENFGPSMAKEPGRYRARYGEESDILGFQAALLLKSPKEYLRAI